MAFFDWNHNDERDMADDYIEYQIYKDVTGEVEDSSYTPNSSNGMSTIGAIISVISGLIGQVLIYSALNIDIEDVPVLVMIVLWIVISAIVAALIETIDL